MTTHLSLSLFPSPPPPPSPKHTHTHTHAHTHTHFLPHHPHKSPKNRSKEETVTKTRVDKSHWTSSAPQPCNNNVKRQNTRIKRGEHRPITTLNDPMMASLDLPVLREPAGKQRTLPKSLTDADVKGGRAARANKGQDAGKLLSGGPANGYKD